MPRKRRTVVEGLPHHITQRGVDRRNVFLSDGDRVRYLFLLKEAAESAGVSFWGYCLMTNHVHLVAIPEAEDSLARCMQRAHAAYSRFFHVIHGGCGHLWENHYFSCVLSVPSSWRALTYVDLNPVRAGLVREPADYRWSSAAAHCGLAQPELPLASMPWSKEWIQSAWARRLAKAEDDVEFERIVRDATLSGVPVGSPEFISGLERRLGRKLLRQRPGPKRKLAAAAGSRQTVACLEIGS